MDELPGPLQKLEPDDAENFLCIYKDRLSKPLLPDEATPIGCTPQDRYVVGTEQIQTLAPRPCSPISKYE
jgi:hypothetical protein